MKISKSNPSIYYIGDTMKAVKASYVFVFQIQQHVICAKCSLRYRDDENEIYMIVEPLYS